MYCRKMFTFNREKKKYENLTILNPRLNVLICIFLVKSVNIYTVCENEFKTRKKKRLREFEKIISKDK